MNDHWFGCRLHQEILLSISAKDMNGDFNQKTFHLNLRTPARDAKERQNRTYRMPYPAIAAAISKI
jgi:hypothetical protein